MSKKPTLNTHPEWMKTITDTIIDGLITIDENGLIQYYNKAAETIFGYPLEEVLNQNVKMLMPQAIAKNHDGYIENYKKTGDAKIIGIGRAVKGLKKNGEEIDLHLSISNVEIEGHKYFSGIVRDITDFVKTETEKAERQKIAEDNYQFKQLIFDNIPDAIFVKDENFKIIRANQKFIDLYPPEQRDKIIGYTTVEAYDKKDTDKFLKQDKIAFKKGISEVEETLKMPNGQTKSFMTKKVKFLDIDNKPYILGIARDITQLKQTQNILLEQKNMFELAEINASLGYWRYNIQTQEITWSNEVYRIHGVTPEEFDITLESALNFYLPEDRVFVQDRIEEVIEKEIDFEFELQIQRPDGEIIDVQSIGYPETDKKGNVVSIFGTFQDITARKEIENRLIRSYQELDNFSYIASHDLKEPLRGIHNHVSFLINDFKDDLNEEILTRLKRMQTLSKSMEKLISDLLKYAKEGRTDPKREDVCVQSVLEDLKNLFSHFENITIEYENDIPLISCDRLKLEEVFRNLISNALKYNSNKEKIIQIGYLKKQEYNNKIHDNVIFVKDNGIGIDPKFHQEVFKIFKRLHYKDQYSEGTGSGLTFVKKMIEQHGGEIWIDSEIGQGTTFYFTLS